MVRQPGALGPDRVLGDLHQDRLAGLEDLLDLAVLALRAERVPVDLAGVDDGVATATDVDERGLHARQDVLHAGEVDVADQRRRGLAVHVVLDQDVVLEDGDLGQVVALPDDHAAGDRLAAGQELGLAEDRRTATAGVPALAAALALGLHPGRPADAGDLVLGRLLRPLDDLRGSRTRTTTSVGSSAAATASSPRRRRRRRRRRVPSPSSPCSSPEASASSAGVSPAASVRLVRPRTARRPRRCRRSRLSPSPCDGDGDRRDGDDDGGCRPRCRRTRRRRRPRPSSVSSSSVSSDSSAESSVGSRRRSSVCGRLVDGVRVDLATRRPGSSAPASLGVRPAPRPRRRRPRASAATAGSAVDDEPGGTSASGAAVSTCSSGSARRPRRPGSRARAPGRRGGLAGPAPGGALGGRLGRVLQPVLRGVSARHRRGEPRRPRPCGSRPCGSRRGPGRLRRRRLVRGRGRLGHEGVQAVGDRVRHGVGAGAGRRLEPAGRRRVRGRCGRRRGGRGDRGSGAVTGLGAAAGGPPGGWRRGAGGRLAARRRRGPRCGGVRAGGGLRLRRARCRALDLHSRRGTCAPMSVALRRGREDGSLRGPAPRTGTRGQAGALGAARRGGAPWSRGVTGCHPATWCRHDRVPARADIHTVQGPDVPCPAPAPATPPVGRRRALLARVGDRPGLLRSSTPWLSRVSTGGSGSTSAGSHGDQPGEHVVGPDERRLVREHEVEPVRRRGRRHDAAAGVEGPQTVLRHPLDLDGLAPQERRQRGRDLARGRHRAAVRTSASRSGGRRARRSARPTPRRRPARSAARRRAPRGPGPGRRARSARSRSTPPRSPHRSRRRSRTRCAGAARSPRSRPSARRPAAARARRPG